MIRKILWAIFAVVCLTQLGVIAFQMVQYERILKDGEVFYFNVLPLDPYDPFRGRYVTLRFENAKAPLAEGEVMHDATKGYVHLAHQEEGDTFSVFSFQKPQKGSFLEVFIAPSVSKKSDTGVSFSLPFDRFYLREEIAPKAESLLRARSGVKVNAKLRVLDGKGVIEALMVGETPLSEFVLKQKEG